MSWLTPLDYHSNEKSSLSVIGVLTMAMGGIAGVVLWRRLSGETVQSGFWSPLLTVSALSALPLVSSATTGVRWWKAPRSPSFVGWLCSATIVVFVLTLAAVGLILNQIAKTPSGGTVPDDWVLGYACVYAGVSLGAAVFVIAAAILDKINTDETDPPKTPPIPPGAP